MTVKHALDLRFSRAHNGLVMANLRRIVNPAEARRKRYERLCALVGLKPGHRVLDVGCGDGKSFEDFNTGNEIVGLDLYQDPKILRDNFSYIRGDGADMSAFGDREFDVVVCIGVLEHVFPFERLRCMAREIARVGKGYAVVVPHTYTVIEPHYQLPFWQLYPDGLKSFLIKRFSIGWYERNPAGEFTPLNYFRRREWQELFPGGSIVSHNHIGPGLIRNYIIYRPWSAN